MPTTTKPTTEQIRFNSTTTGSHVLDDYLSAAEIGERTLPDLLADLFDANGSFARGAAAYQWTGDWAAGVPYITGDSFRDAATESLYVALRNHTSADLVADELAGHIALALDGATVKARSDAAVAAADAAVPAAAAAVPAATAATAAAEAALLSEQAAAQSAQDAQIAAASFSLPDFAGQANRLLALNGAGTELEFVDPTDPIGTVRQALSPPPGPGWLGAGTFLRSEYPELADMLPYAPVEPAGLSASPTNFMGSISAFNPKTGTCIVTNNGAGRRSTDPNLAVWTGSGLPSGVGTTGLAGGLDGVWLTGGSSGIVRRSTNDGINFSTTPTGLESLTGNVYVATDHEGVWIVATSAASSEDRLFRSTDNGATFTPIAPPAGFTAAIQGLYGDGAGTYIAVSASTSVIRSTDNGVTWETFTVPTAIFGTGGFFRAAGANGTWHTARPTAGSASLLWRSTDNGSTWEALFQHGSSGASVATDGAGRWLLVTAGNAPVWFSNDDGEAWIEMGLRGEIFDIPSNLFGGPACDRENPERWLFHWLRNSAGTVVRVSDPGLFITPRQDKIIPRYIYGGPPQ